MKVVFAHWLFICVFFLNILRYPYTFWLHMSLIFGQKFIVNALVCSSVCLVENLMVVNACFGGVLIDCLYGCKFIHCHCIFFVFATFGGRG